MDFHIVVLDEYLSQYPKIEWVDWKDHLSKKMMSQGDHWSKATLKGLNIWDCLEKNNINSSPLVAWKPTKDTLYQVSLPDQTRPKD